jgi:hypothetical protein
MVGQGCVLALRFGIRIVVLLARISLSPSDACAQPGAVTEHGQACYNSGEQRFYEGPIGFRFPLLLSGIADVCEWYDDAASCFRIEVNVHNRRWGPLFGYSGSTPSGLDCPHAQRSHPDDRRRV